MRATEDLRFIPPLACSERILIWHSYWLRVTKNITVKVGADVYSRARETTAAEGTSISALVGGFLADLGQVSLPTDDEYKRRAVRLKSLWAKADRRDGKKSGTAGSLTREETYVARVH